MKKSKNTKKNKSRKIKIAEGPTISESYKDDKGIITGMSWRMSAKCIDAPAYVRGPPKKMLMTHDFLDFLEFRMRQKPTFIERIFGKRMLP